MKGEPLSPAVRTFINENIRSVAELECLLLLQADPQRIWSPADMGRELCIEEQWALTHLQQLSRAGCIVAVDGQTPGYRYEPRSSELGTTLAKLASGYAQYRVSVIELIYARPVDPLQSFADAFRFRKEPPHG